MSDAPVVRASDADRERMVALLREHAAEGRLTLEEFTERIEAAYLARTHGELEALASDLPAAAGPPALRRRPTRLLAALFGSTERAGRLRIGRRVACLMAFGSVDLDLREATLERDVITIVALGVFGAIDVYVPEGVEVDVRGLVIFGSKGTNGDDVAARPGTPLVRVWMFGCFAGMDVWRVPLEWARRSLGEVVEGLSSGRRQELQP